MAISVSNLSFSVSSGLHNNIRTRTQSSLYKNTKTEKINRPKSSPMKFSLDGLDSFYLTPRNQTAPTITQNIPFYHHSCKRSKQVEQELTKQYKFPSGSDKRTLSSGKSIKKTTEESPKVYNIGPGYAIYRNDSDFTIKIDSDEFFGPKKKIEREASTKKYIQDHKDILISQLQEQIAILTVSFEEEKMNHNLSMLSWQEKLESTRTSLINSHEENIEALKEEHLNNIKNLNQDHDIKIEKQKNELNQKIDNSFRELNTYKASFESFRQALIKETDEKIENHKKNLTDEFDEKIRIKLEKQKGFLTANFEIDMEKSKQENLSEIENIISKHKSEVETLKRRFAEVETLEDKLSQTLQELTKKKRDLEKSQAEYNNLYEMYSSVRKEMTIVRNDNENLKSELQEFSDRFEDRVRRVDDDYKERMDSLHNQIIEIRRAYMAKCEELVQERKSGDTQLHGRIETARDVMKELIHTRQRARISLVSIETDEELDGFNESQRRSDDQRPFQTLKFNQTNASVKNKAILCRPSSAPTTEKDDLKAKQNIFLINKN